MKILDNAGQSGLQVPVISMALTNLWGSFFSRIELVGCKRVAMVRPLRRGLFILRGLFNWVGLAVGAPLCPQNVEPALLRARVQALINA